VHWIRGWWGLEKRKISLPLPGIELRFLDCLAHNVVIRPMEMSRVKHLKTVLLPHRKLSRSTLQRLNTAQENAYSENHMECVKCEIFNIDVAGTYTRCIFYRIPSRQLTRELCSTRSLHPPGT
jgi:hypothetical protein